MTGRIFKAIRAGSQSTPPAAEQLLLDPCPSLFSKSGWLKGALSRSSGRSQASGLPVPVDPDVYTRPRDLRLFPIGLGENTPDINSRQRPHDYSSNELRALFLQDQSAAINIEHTHVIEASYCKQREGPQHEFILIKVQDSRYPTLTNFIVLDRTAYSPGITSSHRYKSSPASHELFNAITQTPAQDRFRVSHYGDSNTLIQHCGLRPYQAIESLSFRPDKPLRFFELVVLAQATSSARMMYKLLNAQCYWFAGTVWECMHGLSPKAQHKILESTRGRLHMFQQMTNAVEMTQILDAAKGGILEFKRELTIRLQKLARDHTQSEEEKSASLKRENEELKRKMAEMVSGTTTMSAEHR